MHNELQRLTATPQARAQRFTLKINNTPKLPLVNCADAGFETPILKETPAAIPSASAVVIAWADAEWDAIAGNREFTLESGVFVYVMNLTTRAANIYVTVKLRSF